MKKSTILKKLCLVIITVSIFWFIPFIRNTCSPLNETNPNIDACICSITSPLQSTQNSISL